jgi:hypothetical protein
MKSKIIAGLLVTALGLSMAGTASAHHSFAAEFDGDKTIKLEGVVTKVEWTNPHVWIYFNVKDAATGKNATWGAELGPPHLLQRRGWLRESLALGSKITVDGYLARNGTGRVNAKSVTLSGTGGQPGQKLDAGSSQIEANAKEQAN